MLPPVLGKVSPTLLASIEADLEASGDLTGVTSVDDPVAPAGETEMMLKMKLHPRKNFKNKMLNKQQLQKSMTTVPAKQLLSIRQV